MKKTALFLMAFTIISKLLGFTRDLVLSYCFGVSNITDAYNISLNIPLAVISIITTGVVTGFIPIYGEIEKKHSRQKADTFAFNAVNIAVGISILFIIITFIFPSEVISLFATGFKGETREMAIAMTKITVFSLLFNAVIQVYTAYLNLKGSFVLPLVFSLHLNIINILFIYLGSIFDIRLMVVGNLIGSIIQFLLLKSAMKKQEYRYRLKPRFNDEYIVKMIKIALPAIVGISANQINVLVDQRIASELVIGGISAINYSNKLIQLTRGIFVASIGTVFYPDITKKALNNDDEGFKASVRGTLNYVNIIVVPCVIGMLIFSKEIISLVYGRGKFDQVAITQVASMLFFYSFSLIGVSNRDILAKAFYSMQDTRTPMINGLIGVGINIVLDIVLSRILGLKGLAIATTVASIIIVVLMMISLNRKIGSFGISKVLLEMTKMIVAASIMGGAAYFCYWQLRMQLGFNNAYALLVSIILAIIIYFSIAIKANLGGICELFTEFKKRVKG